MSYCPSCGSSVHEHEKYCVTCGRELPSDLYKRKTRYSAKKLWLLPIATLVFCLIFAGVFYLFLKNRTAVAKEYYDQGEVSLSEGNYEEAKDLFLSALEKKKSFSQATIALDYTEVSLSIKDAIDQAKQEMQQENFQEALALIDETEENLKNYSGSAVSNLINILLASRNEIKIAQINHTLSQKPSVDELKILLWDAEAIKVDEAENIASTIRKYIVDYTFSKANEQLIQHQFSDAILIVEDGLKYAPQSEKLQSLKTTIEKEKVAFETTQEQRITQAIHTAEKERTVNETDAIDLINVDVGINGEGNPVIKGKVKSVATIPVNSVRIDYTLETKKGNVLATNEVFVYPDTLYPEEQGKFEFTHYDIKHSNNLIISINKITWYTE